MISEELQRNHVKDRGQGSRMLGKPYDVHRIALLDLRFMIGEYANV